MPTKLAADFLDRVERSGLVAADKLAQLVDELTRRGRDVENPQVVADAFVENETLTRWQADNLLQGKHKGFFLGSYRLLRPLGRGGMGTVYLAQHEMMRRRCALKVLPQTQLHEGSSILERFYVEAQAVAAMDHQNIVRAYDVNKESKDNKVVHYLVMEYVEGQDLQGLVQESGPLDYIKAADYLRQTANGLAHAHENRLVHRDIKPANLLVDKKGTVKILDLGLARLYDDSDQASLTTTHNETVLGTADYLSPEQALNSHNVDHRTDIYSLGCTAYYLLTGHPPFPEGSVAQRLVAHQIKQPKSLTEERRDAPRDLVAIVEKLMAKNADERFQSAAEISTTLAAWLVQHGGEDWCRQHTEITGDSSVLSMLKQREPTRAMSSPSSETELELAPLDADGDLPNSSRITLAPQTARRPSDSKTRKNADAPAGGSTGPGEQRPDKVGSDIKRAAAKPATSQKPPAAKTAALPDLEPLDDLPDADLGSLESSDLLGGLNSADLMGLPDQALPTTSAADDWLQTRPAGASLGTPNRRPAPVPPKGLFASITSVGMPIVIGSACGVVLVAIVIVVMWLRSSSPQVASNPPRPAEQVTAQQNPKPESPVPSGPASSDKPSSVPATSGASQQSKPKSTDAQPTSDRAPKGNQPNTKNFTGTPDVAKPAALGASEKTDGRTKPDPQPTEPAAASSKSTEQPQPASPKAADPVNKPQEKPRAENSGAAAKPKAAAGGTTKSKAAVSSGSQNLKPPVETVAMVSPEVASELLAQIKDITPELKFDPKSVPAMVIPMTQRAIEDALNSPTLGLKVSEGSPAKFVANLTASRENEFAVFRLAAEVRCPDSDGKTVTVWSQEQEIGRFTQRALHNTPTMMRGKITDFMQRFQRDYRKAAGTKRG